MTFRATLQAIHGRHRFRQSLIKLSLEVVPDRQERHRSQVKGKQEASFLHSRRTALLVEGHAAL